jgi:hypothetical protein
MWSTTHNLWSSLQRQWEIITEGLSFDTIWNSLACQRFRNAFKLPVVLLCVKTCFNVKEYVKHSANFPSVFWIAPHICEYPSWKEELGSYT